MRAGAGATRPGKSSRGSAGSTLAETAAFKLSRLAEHKTPGVKDLSGVCASLIEQALCRTSCYLSPLRNLIPRS
jgi:hypothetical protein